MKYNLLLPLLLAGTAAGAAELLRLAEQTKKGASHEST